MAIRPYTEYLFIIDNLQEIDVKDAEYLQEIQQLVCDFIGKVGKISKIVFEKTDSCAGMSQALGQIDDDRHYSLMKPLTLDLLEKGEEAWVPLAETIENDVLSATRNRMFGRPARVIKRLADTELSALPTLLKTCMLEERVLMNHLLIFNAYQQFDCQLFIDSPEFELNENDPIIFDTNLSDKMTIAVESPERLLFNLLSLSIIMEVGTSISNLSKVRLELMELLEFVDSEDEEVAKRAKTLYVIYACGKARTGKESHLISLRDRIFKPNGPDDHRYLAQALPLFLLTNSYHIMYDSLRVEAQRKTVLELYRKEFSLVDRVDTRLALFNEGLFAQIFKNNYYEKQEKLLRFLEQRWSPKANPTPPPPAVTIEKKFNIEELLNLFSSSDLREQRHTPKSKKKKGKSNQKMPQRPSFNSEGSSSTTVQAVVSEALSECERVLKEVMSRSLIEDRRVRRWRNLKSSEQIKEFTDRGIATYSQIESEGELDRLRHLHAFPPIERVYFDPELRKRYCEEVGNGFKMVGYMEWKDKKVWGSIEIGLDRNRVVHRYFKPTDHHKVSFADLIRGEIIFEGDTFEQELESDEILFRNSVVKISSQKIVSVHHEGCSIFALPIYRERS